MASSSASAKPSVGILSIGDMGMGIAKLLLAHGYQVLTVSAGRSQNTIDRIRAAKITDVTTDEELLAQADIILSIVPPRDALATAKRVIDVCRTAATQREDTKGPNSNEVIYIDLNAVSPKTISKMNALFASLTSITPAAPSTPSIARRLTRTLSFAGAQLSNSGTDQPKPQTPISVKFLDGGIIGAPPSREKDTKEKSPANSTKNSSTTSVSSSHNTTPNPTNNTTTTWKKPSIPLSGPHESSLTPTLLTALNAKFISPRIGTASALKACYASLTKGLTALSILSYTTAATCGVLPELKSHLEEFAPQLAALTAKGLTGMPPKAYRWVDEMREIGTTFKSSGAMRFGGELFEQMAEVYRFVGEETVLGQEKVGKRKRGLTVEDVAECVEEGVQRKMAKKEGKDEKLELAWRGSWGL